MKLMRIYIHILMNLSDEIQLLLTNCKLATELCQVQIDIKI